jgi:GNAT superfamily N-acetyltransferase
VLVRPRTDDDLVACEAIARAVQRVDGYPPHLPQELRRFIAEPDALSAWVAEADGTVVGHVALHPCSSDEVMALACDATQLPVERLAVVARLFVSPDGRRAGAGRRLLSAASNDAGARGLQPILDVGTIFSAAINLYESAGWTRAGEVAVTFREMVLYEYVYIGPSPKTARRL